MGNFRKIAGEENMDWASLLPELLQLIAMKLTDICDNIRFRAVCSSWRLAAGTHVVQPQLPWLIIANLHDTFFNFFTLSNPHCVYGRDHPDLREKWILGSAYGWLFVTGKPKYNHYSVSPYLLNPITRDRTMLPEWYIRIFPQKVVISSHPSSPPPQILVAMSFRDDRLALFRKGDERWTKFSTGRANILDIAFLEHKLYVFETGGVLAILQEPFLEASTLIHLSGTLQALPSNDYRMIATTNDLLLLCYTGDNGDIRILKLVKSYENDSMNWESLGIINIPLLKSNIFCAAPIYVIELPNQTGYRIYLVQHYPSSKSKVRVIDIIPGVNIVEKICYEAPVNGYGAYGAWIVPHLH